MILSYQRYVDDIFICIKKGHVETLLREMNSFDQNYLQFTTDKMTNNTLNFLDTQLFVDDKGIFQFRKYRKPTASDFLVDYHCSVTPKKYKISTLQGEIHRCNHTNSTNFELEIALQNLKKEFLLNNYPKRLIEEHIEEIKSRNFAPRFDRVEHEREIRDNPDRNYTITLPFTSSRCEKIQSKIKKIIKTIAPSYKLNFAWSSERISRFYNPRLKPKLDVFERPGVVYKNTCPCGLTYVGETKRRLNTRIREHGRPSSKTAISAHIFSCPNYDASLDESHGDQLNPTVKFNFLKSHFKVLHQNFNRLNQR